jgi:Cytochrome c554 and c-prime
VVFTGLSCRWLFFGAVSCFAATTTVAAQTPATIADQLSTPEHVKKAGWWPTKGSAARADFVGTGKCASCHSEIANTQKETHMAQDSMPAPLSDLLRTHEKINFTLGPYSYQIARTGSDEVFSVTNGTQSISELLTWAFGTGNNGQSYLLEHEGKLYEARLSYFRAYDRFAITPNHPTTPDDSLEKAIGRHISPDEAPKCFGCHTTASTAGDKFDPAHAMPGITCEQCHGPGATHVAARKSGLEESGIGTEFSPAHLSPAESVDFCGACHRTWWDVNLAGLTGIGTLRFPAYRLEKSRCWGKGDARVTCVACHDPHQPLVKDSAAYDNRCLSCHVNGAGVKLTADHPGTACPVAQRDCASCHMQKYEVPDMHTKFTDHMIRVVRKDEAFPQ